MVIFDDGNEGEDEHMMKWCLLVMVKMTKMKDDGDDSDIGTFPGKWHHNRAIVQIGRHGLTARVVV